MLESDSLPSSRQPAIAKTGDNLSNFLPVNLILKWSKVVGMFDNSTVFSCNSLELSV